MTKVDFWELSERVRLELGDQVEFLAMHPRLCEEDGERLMAHLLDNSIQFITPACLEKKQAKLLRDGFQKADVPMDADHWIPVNMSKQDTETVFAHIKAALAPSVEPQG
jgi:hypothetical protein